MVIVATSILQESELTSEKSLNDLSAEKLFRIFEVNTIAPLLIAKHFLPKLTGKQDLFLLYYQLVLLTSLIINLVVGILIVLQKQL